MAFYIDPVLINIGPISIRYYGLVFALGILAVYILLMKKRDKLHLSEEECSNLILYAGIGLLVFGRLFHFLFWQPFVLLKNPLTLFMIWNGGMSFYGGLIGVILGVYIYSKRHKKDFLRITDILVIPAAVALIFGRLANFINQELVGYVTNVPWCVEYALIEGCRHPYQLYAAVSHILLAFIVWYIVVKVKKKGAASFAFLIGYGILRFITDFFRDYQIEGGWALLGITSWQYVSLIVAIIGIYYYRK